MSASSMLSQVWSVGRGCVFFMLNEEIVDVSSLVVQREVIFKVKHKGRRILKNEGCKTFKGTVKYAFVYCQVG